MDAENKTVQPEVTLQSLAAIVAQQNETIATLMQSRTTVTAEAPKLPSIPKDAIKVGNKEYKWNVAVFSFPGSDAKITAEEASLDKTILAKILKIEGQGLLQEQV